MLGSRVLMWLVLLAGLATGCSDGADTTEPALAIDTPSENAGLSWSMAADSLAELDGLADETLIVPSDAALLALDADALADLLALDRLGGLIADSVIRAGYNGSVEEGDIYVMTNGDSVFVTVFDGQLLLNEHPLLEATSLGAATVLVVDGVVVAP